MTGFKRTGLTDRSRQDELLKVAEQAAAWLIELEEGGAAERAACAAWLEESPLHVEMFLRATSVDRMTELMAPEDVRALAQKKWDTHGTVVGFPGPNAIADRSSGTHLSDAAAPSRGSRSGWARFAAIAAGLAVLVAGGMWYEWSGPGSWDTYETKIGEQRVVSLADGSMIYVNTDSQINVRYTDKARDVQLRDGEALFKVEHDARRPFQVQVGNTIVQAVGTEFNIYRRSGGTRVAVVEGVVQVSQASGSATAAGDPVAHDASGRSGRITERLVAGQGLNLAQDGALEKTTAVSVSQVTAWRQRRLVFEWRTLDEIAAEFNRYNRAPQIRVEGNTVGQRRYTAVFDADNPQTLLRFLSKDENLKFAAEGDDFVIRAR